MNVNSLLPTNANSNARKEARALVSKWEKTGLLEGLKNEIETQGMAVLLENQAKQLVTEANQTGTDSNSEEWSGVALPLVRRIFAEIAAKDFVSVQPMNLPSGLVFYLDFKYGNDLQGGLFQTGAARTSQEDSVFGVTDAARGTTAPSQGLYGAGRFGYSINAVTSSNLNVEVDPGAGVAVSANKFVTGSVNPIDVNFNTEFLASTGSTAALIQTLDVRTADLVGADVNAVRSFNLTNDADITAVYPEFTKLVSRATANDTVRFVVKLASAGVAVTDLQVVFSIQPTATSRGDFEVGNVGQQLDANGKIQIPTIDLQMRSEAIVAKTRKLKAVWTPEFAQDLNAYHSIDAEAELTSMLSEYISQEIDLEILDMLIENGQTTERWSARVGYEYDTATNHSYLVIQPLKLTTKEHGSRL
jgi:hypothetical protein